MKVGSFFPCLFQQVFRWKIFGLFYSMNIDSVTFGFLEVYYNVCTDGSMIGSMID